MYLRSPQAFASLRSSIASLCILSGVVLPSLCHGQGERRRQEIPWDHMDLGAFHTGTFKVADQLVTKGIAIKVGGGDRQATVLFDPELLRVSASWTGGFLQFPRGRGGLE